MRTLTIRRSTVAGVAMLILVVSLAAGRARQQAPAVAAAVTPSEPVFVATATRIAELRELTLLRTQAARAASPAVCTTPVPASPTAAPTPVPPVAAGQPLPYAGNWTVKVDGLVTLRTIGPETATGIFARVSLTITNNETAPRIFPGQALILVDDKGRRFAPSPGVSTLAGKGWNHAFPPSLPTSTAIVFDVAPDVGQTFILQSSADPTFRVKIETGQRG